jgi:hypothetical protein
MSNLPTSPFSKRRRFLRLGISIVVFLAALLLGLYLYTQSYQTEVPLTGMDYGYLVALLIIVLISFGLILREVKMNEKP